MKAATHLYVHGGPGFNSVAEETLLGPALADRGINVRFWNEPSRSRPDGAPFQPDNAYQRLLASLRSTLDGLCANGTQVTLIAHSFGAHAAIRVAAENPSRIGRLILLTPSLNAFPTFRNVIHAAQRDLAQAGHPQADALARLARETRTVFDPAMQEAFGIVAQDPSLIVNYWHQKNAMESYLRVWMDRKLGMDAESFFCVLADFSADTRPLPVLEMPTLAIFGQHDVIEMKEDDEPLARKHFPDLQIHTFGESAHFPHLEELRRFVELA